MSSGSGDLRAELRRRLEFYISHLVFDAYIHGLSADDILEALDGAVCSVVSRVRGWAADGVV